MDDRLHMDDLEVPAEVVPDTTGDPYRPVSRCKRCGCWLNSQNEDRKYCSLCESLIRRGAGTCMACGEPLSVQRRGAIRCPVCETKYQRKKRVCKACGKDFLPYVCAACKGKGKRTRTDICHSCHWQKVHAEEAARRERTCSVCGCRFLPRRCIVPSCREKLRDVCTVCHEEIKHMGMKAIVWTLPECGRCHKAIEALKAQHRRVEERDLEALTSGEEPNVEAMAQLALGGMAAPVVYLDDHFLSPEEIDALVGGKGRA